MGMILTALFAVISANALWELLSILVSGIVGEKEKDRTIINTCKWDRW